MRRIREILRLKAECFSDRQIAEAAGIARSTVQECLRRSRIEGLSWEDAQHLDEVELHARLYRSAGRPARAAPLPDFALVHAELGSKGMTRELLWQEYKARHPEGVQYTAFCNHYRAWLATQETVFRQHHVPGEKLFVDYAGKTMPITDRHTGEVKQAQIFVAVLGASNYTFAEATLSQALPDWLGSHVRALKFFGGAPRIIVPDNLRSAVTKAHRYDPQINQAYQDFAEHYKLAVLPARVRRPRDKAKVEGGVLIVTRWILARLRHQTFFSLGDLNAAISQWLTVLNDRPFKKLPGCRRSRFAEQELPALAPLPPRHYEFAKWKEVKVHPDYHVQIDRGFYSVPYRMVGKLFDARVSEHIVELYYRGRLVTAHYRNPTPGHFHTKPEHRPPEHSAQIDQTMNRMLDRAEKIGPATREVIERQAMKRKHPEQTLRSAQGIVRMAQDFSPERLEQACVRALSLGVSSYRSIETLVKTPAPEVQTDSQTPEHPNLRGSTYFH